MSASYAPARASTSRAAASCAVCGGGGPLARRSPGRLAAFPARCSTAGCSSWARCQRSSGPRSPAASRSSRARSSAAMAPASASSAAATRSPGLADAAGQVLDVGRWAQTVEELQLRAVPGHSGAAFVAAPLGRGQRGQALLHGAHEGLQPLAARLLLGHRLRGGHGQRGEVGRELRPLPLQAPRHLPGRLADGVEQAQLQQPDEQILALGRLGLEEPGELALGQDHAGRELLRGQPEQGGDLRVQLPGVARHHLPRPLQPGLPRRRPAVAEAHDPDGRPALAGDVEVQPHPGLGAALRDDGRHLPFVAQPGHRAVEGEDHGVDDARLPGSGRAGQREQLDPLEVDDGPLAERGEPLHLETDGPHPACSSTSSVKSDSRSSSTAPRVSVR